MSSNHREPLIHDVNRFLRIEIFLNSLEPPSISYEDSDGNTGSVPVMSWFNIDKITLSLRLKIL